MDLAIAYSLITLSYDYDSGLDRKGRFSAMKNK